MPRAPYYEHRGITLYHGDCREILPELESGSADMAITDPPYLVSYRGRWGSDWEGIQGDSDPSWLEPAFVEIWRVLKQDSLCLSFYGWPHADTFLGAWKLVGFRPVSLIVFLKQKWGLGYFSRTQHETAYLLAKNHPPRPESAMSDVIPWNHIHLPFHPNEKPLNAIVQLVSVYTSPGDCILDPFVGSGTTLLAARNQGRRAIGIEIEEVYCEWAAMRLSQESFDFEEPSPAAESTPAPEQLKFSNDLENRGD